MKRSIHAALLCAGLLASTQMAIADDIRSSIVAPVQKGAAILSRMHKKATRALVNAAQDNTFADYFDAHSDHERHSLKTRIDHISLNVQSSFSVEEMCLIDPDGAEVSRIVGTKIANDLSAEEASADFFAPAFAQRPQTAYISAMYMSPDADKWVVAYVTPVVKGDQKRAILHYEHGLDVYQKALDRVRSGDSSVRLAVTENGWIVWDSRKPVDVIKRGDSEDPADYFEHFAFAGRSITELTRSSAEGGTHVTLDGVDYPMSFRKVEDWYLVAFEEQNPSVLSELDD